MSIVSEFFDRLAPTWELNLNEKLPLVKSLLDEVEIKNGDDILDLGCGNGIISELLFSYSKKPILGVDVSKKMIETANKRFKDNPNISFKCLDFLTCDINQSFDLIVIYNAYPHFVDRDKFLNSLKKALKPKGRFVIMHSLSREALTTHHEGLSSKISRNLLPVEEESQFYLQDFNLLKAHEDEKHYFMLFEIK